MFRKRVVLALTMLLLFAPIGTAEAQTATQLTISVPAAEQTLTAGFKNNATITITNSYSSGNVYPSAALYDVDITVSLPTPLQMFGDNHWHYDMIALKQSVSIRLQVYAPTSAVGSTYQCTVTANYRELGDLSYTTETHQVSFSVQGWVNLVLYGVQVTTSAAVPGGNSTISGNLLNSGNLAAYNANVTIKSDALSTTSTASLFLGEIDPNIPRPFSLLVSFRKNLPEGNYSITVKVTAIDTNMPASPYSVQKSTPIQIRKPVIQTPTGPRPGSGGIREMILEILRILYGLFFGPQTLPFSFDWSKVLTANMYVELGS